MKTKTLIPATIIALALIAAACGSGGDSDNVSTFNPAPEATVSVETVPETTEELRERVPTTEVPVTTEREATTVPDEVPTTDTDEELVVPVEEGDPEVEPFDYSSLPEGRIVYEDGLTPEDLPVSIPPPPIGVDIVSRTPDGFEVTYDLDFSLLPEYTNFKIVNGEKLIYSKELDAFTTCNNAINSKGTFNEYGYCTLVEGPAVFIDNDGNYVGSGTVVPPEIAAQDRKARDDFARELTGGHRGE